MANSLDGRLSTLSKTSVATTCPGYARMDGLTIGPQVANLPHLVLDREGGW